MTDDIAIAILVGAVLMVIGIAALLVLGQNGQEPGYIAPSPDGHRGTANRVRPAEHRAGWGTKT